MSRSVALVTGGASGVGAAIAARLRTDGLMVSTFDLSPVDAPGAYTVDVTDRDEIEKALVEIRANFGPIDVLVNAAGIEGQSRFLDMSFDEWSHVVNVNLHGVFHCAQAVLPDMMRRRWGRIVNISSSSTHSGVPLKAHYVAAKSAVNGLTKALALEYGPRGITVNGVPPGFIDTPMLRNSAARGDFGPFSIDDIIARTPVRRIGLPADVAALCSFLVSKEAGYITGQIIGVNGGRNT